MNLTKYPLSLALFAGIVAVEANVQPSSSTDVIRTGPFADPAANASAALNNGGNPAAAIGAAHLSDSAAINTAPTTVGNAGTVGVNGQTGSNAAASSINGVSTVGTQNVESIGMRRERLQSRSADEPRIIAAPETSLHDAAAFDSRYVAGEIRSATLDAREQLGAQLERNLQSGERAMTAARVQARNLDRAAKAQFDDALNRVRHAERRLQQSATAAQSATPDTWDRVRATLAADYEAYSNAIAQTQHLAVANSANSGAAPVGNRR